MSETTSFNPSSEYINALLCKVAYEGVSVGDSFLDLDSSEFSEAERNFLFQNYEVVDSSSDLLKMCIRDRLYRKRYQGFFSE